MIIIVDYGTGNLGSVKKAMDYIGCSSAVTKAPGDIAGADGIILPGVGSFADASENLRRTGMQGALRKAIDSGKPFLGICLGMQLLMEWSEEGGFSRKGLGIFKGSVRRFSAKMGLKIPHVGWNSLDIIKKDVIFAGLPAKPYVYFVHSYHVAAESRDVVSASSSYGTGFDAALASGKIYGTQFHPEKSGDTGLLILRNFAAVVYGS
ncbi:MAG: imidazole glycerol phosphate synthase subunit HisH [Eubacteriales bacterium]|nr:imidazole glycerol phosphate synthase subunit HisH [Eubacteriales bacterium]